jgi:hypothetical protein
MKSVKALGPLMEYAIQQFGYDREFVVTFPAPTAPSIYIFEDNRMIAWVHYLADQPTFSRY